MKFRPNQLRRALPVAGCLAAFLLAGAPARAQSMKPAGDGTTIQDPSAKAPKQLQGVGIDQKLDAQVPADLAFRDEAGQSVRFGDYYAKGRPVLLTLVYYQCPRMCTAVLNEMKKALMLVSLNPGSDFEVVVVSFDPREKPELAAKKKDEYTRAYRRPGTENGWHFLTGDEPDIRRLADAVGFRYQWDEAHQQYVHAGGLIVLTPGGRTAKYLYGSNPAPMDIKLSLLDASGGKIGSASDVVLQYCFEYDPHSGRYSFSILNVVRAFGGLTVLAVGAFVVRNLIRDRNGRHAIAAAAAGPPPADAGQPSQSQAVKDNR